MARPKKNRIVSYHPNISYFKPRGIPMLDLEEVCLTIDEREAIRLADLMEMPYEEAGQQMGVSRATFGRIVQKARKVIADALINGKAINIEGGSYTLVNPDRNFACSKCNHKWNVPYNAESPQSCPLCDNEEFHEVSES